MIGQLDDVVGPVAESSSRLWARPAVARAIWRHDPHAEETERLIHADQIETARRCTVEVRRDGPIVCTNHRIGQRPTTRKANDLIPHKTRR